MTMFSQDEFKKYATKHKGISSLNLHRFESTVSSYINPTIIEERQLNVASMDCIFPVNDGSDYFPRSTH